MIFWMKELKTTAFSFKLWVKLEKLFQKTLRLRKVAESKLFDALMMFVLFINMIVIVLSYFDFGEDWASRLDLAD